jgi:hypothetical protein
MTDKHHSDELVDNLLPIVTAAYALKGRESIVLILRTEAKRLSSLGFTATSADVYMAARLLYSLTESARGNEHE